MAVRDEPCTLLALCPSVGSFSEGGAPAITGRLWFVTPIICSERVKTRFYRVLDRRRKKKQKTSAGLCK